MLSLMLQQNQKQQYHFCNFFILLNPMYSHTTVLKTSLSLVCKFVKFSSTEITNVHQKLNLKNVKKLQPPAFSSQCQQIPKYTLAP